MVKTRSYDLWLLFHTFTVPTAPPPPTPPPPTQEKENSTQRWPSLTQRLSCCPAKVSTLALFFRAFITFSSLSHGDTGASSVSLALPALWTPQLHHWFAVQCVFQRWEKDATCDTSMVALKWMWRRCAKAVFTKLEDYRDLWLPIHCGYSLAFAELFVSRVDMKLGPWILRGHLQVAIPCPGQRIHKYPYPVPLTFATRF